MRHPHRHRGFTLLELLVVLVIIGVVVSLAVITLPKSDQGLEQESRRLAALIDLAAQEAVLQGQELALELRPDGYAFLTYDYDGKKWRAVQEDTELRPRQLPAALKLEAQVEGEQIKLGGEDDKAEGPRIYALSSGEMTPFQLTLRAEGADQGYRIKGDALGHLELSGPVNVF